MTGDAGHNGGKTISPKCDAIRLPTSEWRVIREQSRKTTIIGCEDHFTTVGDIVKRLLATQAWAPELLQFRVFGFRLFQDGNIGVGVFPEGEEILVGGLCLGRIPRQNQRSRQ